MERGLSIEVFKTVAAVAACVVSIIYYSELGEFLSAHSFLSLQVAQFLAFSIIFFSLLFIFKVVRVLLFKVLRLELLPSWEKWGGLTLGLARSAVFASLFLFGLTLLPVNYLKESVQERSFSGPHLIKVAPKVADFIGMFKPKKEEKI